MKYVFLILLVCGLFLQGPSGHATEDSFSDNSISYRYNFLIIDTSFSRANDPVENSTSSATRFYGIYRRDWNMHKITGPDFSASVIISDVALHMGGDLNTMNTTFGPKKELLVISPKLQFALTRGYFNIAFDYSQEALLHNTLYSS